MSKDKQKPQQVVVHEWTMSEPIPLFSVSAACRQCEAEGVKPMFILPAGALTPAGPGGIVNPNSRPQPAYCIVSRYTKVSLQEKAEAVTPPLVSPAP